jgi:hypothetical protein
MAEPYRYSSHTFASVTWKRTFPLTFSTACSIVAGMCYELYYYYYYLVTLLTLCFVLLRFSALERYPSELTLLNVQYVCTLQSTCIK